MIEAEICVILFRPKFRSLFVALLLTIGKCYIYTKLKLDLHGMVLFAKVKMFSSGRTIVSEMVKVITTVCYLVTYLLCQGSKTLCGVLCPHVKETELGFQSGDHHLVHGNVFAIKLNTAYLQEDATQLVYTHTDWCSPRS